MDYPSSLRSRRVPVSLLTGFLGSGKTTVLNSLLGHSGMARTVVIINEFGEIGLDHDLIENATEDMVMLQSGCLCCTIRGDLVETLHSLLDRRERGEVAAFDRVVIETTGLADPAPILHTLMTAPRIVTHFELDGVITTVDAAAGAATLDRQVESVKQAAVADRLLLTKTDLVPTENAAALEGRLRRINPGASILRVLNGAADPAMLFDVGLYNPDTKSPDVRQWLKAEAFDEEHAHDHDGHAHHHDVNRHDEQIRAVCVTLDEPVPDDMLDTWLDVLLFFRGQDILRIKGIVNVVGLDGPLVIHGVQHIFHPPVVLKKWPSADRRSRIVFIARDLDEQLLRDTLEILLADQPRTPVSPVGDASLAMLSALRSPE